MLPAPLLQNPGILHPMPMVIPPTQEGPGLRYQPNHLLLDPDLDPNQGTRKSQIL